MTEKIRAWKKNSKIESCHLERVSPFLFQRRLNSLSSPCNYVAFVFLMTTYVLFCFVFLVNAITLVRAAKQLAPCEIYAR